MKPFHFQYQKILDIKHKDVDTAKKIFSSSAKELEDAKAVYEEYKIEELALQRELAEVQSTSTFTLCNGYQYYLKLKKQREEQLRRVRELEKVLIIKHRELMQAYKEEKKWDKLSEIKKEAYVFEQSKLDQENLDEISLRQYGMKK
ncbi:flagellar export protein FliJ [Desulfuribacillus alkaliarsenatis]|uniref:Flagellar FliJ protein n=1 Tax=Desulfuribacillus alkaliarsenatis TaxID=766136 RepID=A0A1E5G5Y8_9FIRM|nr:flagellar FliJ family protein [Desulfuribacillus alkaliarsenatis]OEF98608.1 hypothetical protein BHF68_02790 [Desulfuribacillus alkaliarsenatis]